MSRLRRSEDQKRVDHADNRPGKLPLFICVHKRTQVVSAVDLPTNGHSAVAENAISAQRTLSAEGSTIESISSDRRAQARLESGHMVQASERTRKDNDVHKQETYTTQLDSSREQRTDTLVERSSNQHASLDANGVITRTSDKSAECSARCEEQVVQECKPTFFEKCEGEHSSARSDSNPALQEHTVVVVSPQVCMNVHQAATVMTATGRLGRPQRVNKDSERKPSPCDLEWIQAIYAGTPGAVVHPVLDLAQRKTTSLLAWSNRPASNHVSGLGESSWIVP
ncbi:hypothetical protein J3R83DRAFT_9185 [Lanmaoa asiatica]|nr:hypothetical protein J3R83DRAFT_9185 [Lanmaoa asiatica]